VASNGGAREQCRPARSAVASNPKQILQLAAWCGQLPHSLSPGGRFSGRQCSGGCSKHLAWLVPAATSLCGWCQLLAPSVECSC
jgi:hypothetical protein